MISFQLLDVNLKIGRKEIKNNIKNLIKSEGFVLGDISLVFCTDDYLLSINQSYLNHDYFTDIITFDYSSNKLISGDLLISVDRVLENAKLNKTEFNNELFRVIYHGILHLCGYKDKSFKDKKLMTEKENFYLHLFHCST
jgi:probable rRNA maturation factor